MTLLDWALRIAMAAATVLVYLMGLDRKRVDERIETLRADILERDTRQSYAVLTSRAEVKEQIDRIGEEQSKHGSRTQGMITMLETRLNHEAETRHMRADRLAVDLGTLQLAQARQDERIKMLERRRTDRKE